MKLTLINTIACATLFEHLPSNALFMVSVVSAYQGHQHLKTMMTICDEEFSKLGIACKRAKWHTFGVALSFLGSELLPAGGGANTNYYHYRVEGLIPSC